MNTTSTIAALATAPAPAGVAVIRMSGPAVKRTLSEVFSAKQSPVEFPRQLIYGSVIDFESRQIIDRALCVYMPAPKSFTGEDVAEFQLHGSPFLVERMLHSLYRSGIAPAEPGEFSKRAFLNGKLDLIQAEAIADLINASSEQALKIAGEHLAGRFSTAIEKLGEPLRDCLAELEASIDFPEEDIHPDSLQTIQNSLDQNLRQIETLLNSYRFGAALREGFRVLLCGAPNAGKSSLLNLLLGKQRAIVTEISGTTRDLIEESALFDGYQFVFCDSAGLTETDNTVEKIGIELAREKISWADLVLLVVDSSSEDSHWEQALSQIQGKAKAIWMVVNKIDLNPSAIGRVFCDSKICHRNFYLSAKTQAGLDSLRDALVDEVAQSAPASADFSEVITSLRHKNCLLSAREALLNARSAIAQKLPTELISAELRLALVSLDELVGKTYTEDILGRIFSKFCIGK